MAAIPNYNMYVGFMAGMATFGATIEKIDGTSVDNLTYYISVPETSEHKDADGKELSGMFLAKRIKRFMKTAKIPGVLKAKIRKEEHWTRTKGKEAHDSIIHMK